jgi:hypothetical protein
VNIREITTSEFNKFKPYHKAKMPNKVGVLYVMYHIGNDLVRGKAVTFKDHQTQKCYFIVFRDRDQFIKLHKEIKQLCYDMPEVGLFGIMSLVLL